MEKRTVRSLGKTLVLALGLWWVFTGLASPAEAAPTLTLEQPVHFVASDGSDIVAEAGTYQVDAVESRLLLLTAEGRPPLLFNAEATTHNEEIDAPLAVTVPDEDSDVLHVVLALPNGQGLDAAGSLSGIRPRGTEYLLARSSQLQDAIVEKSALPSVAPQGPSVTLTQAVHFAAPDGSDIVAEAGTYQVDAEESRLNLTAEGRTPLLLNAEATTHNEEIDAPLAVIVPGEDSDVLHVVLVLPNGLGLDAAGSLSGTRPRGTSPLMFSQFQFHAAVLAQPPQAPQVRDHRRPSGGPPPPPGTVLPPRIITAPTTGTLALPDGPSVVLYEHPNFGGRSKTLGVGNHSLSDFNDLASSIKVPNGLVALLYEHADAGGGYGIAVDLLEDRPDLSQVSFNKKPSYVRVFSSPNPQGYIWARASVQNGQFVAGHWERQRASGTPVNTIAVVSPPIPSSIKVITTIQVNDAQSTITSLGQQSSSDSGRWNFAKKELMGVIGSDFRGSQEIGSASFEREAVGDLSPTIGLIGGAVPDLLDFWFPQKQPNDRRRSPYFKRTLSGTIDVKPPPFKHPHIADERHVYLDFDLNIDILPSAPYQYLITEGHKPEKADMEAVKDVLPGSDASCTTPFRYIESEIDIRTSGKTKMLSLVRTRSGKQIAVYGPWIYDKAHCHQSEIHPAEQVWWSAPSGSDTYYNLNLFCDASGRFWWRDQMDDGSKLKPWGAPPITGTFAIAFEVKIGNPTMLFEVTNLGDYNVAFVSNSNKPHNLVYQNRTLVSFVPRNDAFKVSYENVGLEAGTTDIVHGFLVIEATVGTVTQIATHVAAITVPGGRFGPPTVLLPARDFPPGTDPNKIDQRYERRVFRKVDGHYMFIIREHSPGPVNPNQNLGNINIVPGTLQPNLKTLTPSTPSQPTPAAPPVVRDHRRK